MTSTFRDLLCKVPRVQASSSEKFSGWNNRSCNEDARPGAHTHHVPSTMQLVWAHCNVHTQAPRALSPSSMLDLFGTLHNECNDLKRKQLYKQVMHILALYKVLFQPVLSPAHCDHALDQTALQINVQGLHFGQVSGSRVKCSNTGCWLLESSKLDQGVCYLLEDGCRRFPCIEILDGCRSTATIQKSSTLHNSKVFPLQPECWPSMISVHRSHARFTKGSCRQRCY